MSYLEDETYWSPETHPRKRINKKKLHAPQGVHVPNKNEAKVLRKIMSETGLSEEEIRSHKKYRIELSEAQKKQGTKTSSGRRCLRILKSVTRELKLPKEHPDVVKAYSERLAKERKCRGFFL